MSITNFVLEFGLGILFILLWRFFNKLLKSPQFGISKRKRCWNNIGASIIITLYYVASVGFELLVLVIAVETLNNAEYEMVWSGFNQSMYFSRFAMDFVSCIVILYLMYAFGP